MKPSRERHAEILGAGPRIAPLRPDELTPDAMAIRSELKRVAGRGEADPTLENTPEIIATLLRHPQLLQSLMQMGVQFLGESALDARDREIAILRVAWLCQAPYEWGEHVIIAGRLGIAGDAIQRIMVGSDAAGWDDRDHALVRAVEELHANAMISDGTWAVLARFLDEKQLIELPVLVGFYQTAAYYQNTLRLRLHDGNPGLDAR